MRSYSKGDGRTLMLREESDIIRLLFPKFSDSSPRMS